MKASPRSLIQAHYATLVDARTGKSRLQDHAVFEILPILAFVAGWILGVSLSTPASAALLTVLGLLGAFLFGVMLQISERALFWADAEPEPGPDTSRQAIFLEEIAANAGYAALISICAAAVFVVTSMTGDTALVIFSAFGLALAVHLVLVLLMVMVRVFALTQQRLLDSRTGATVTSLPRRKAG